MFVSGQDVSGEGLASNEDPLRLLAVLVPRFRQDQADVRREILHADDRADEVRDLEAIVEGSGGNGDRSSEQPEWYYQSIHRGGATGKYGPHGYGCVQESFLMSDLQANNTLAVSDTV